MVTTINRKLMLQIHKSIVNRYRRYKSVMTQYRKHKSVMNQRRRQPINHESAPQAQVNNESAPQASFSEVIFIPLTNGAKFILIDSKAMFAPWVLKKVNGKYEEMYSSANSTQRLKVSDYFIVDK